MYKKITILFSFFLFLVLSLAAQQNHFIYLQTENKQPFYIKLDKKLLSSSASGYLIIPKLQDGNYLLTVGFPKNEWPEQNVTCKINKKDAGYLLKDFGDKGWGLFNLQTMEVAMAGIKNDESKNIVKENKKDNFSDTVSKVVKEPSINSKTEINNTVIKEEIKPVIQVAKKQEQPKLQTGLEKLLSNNSAEGIEMVYIDFASEKPDTIRVFIPAEKNSQITQLPKKIQEPVAVAEPKKDSPIITKTKSAAIELPIPNPKADAVSEQIIPVIIPEKQKENIIKPVIVNSDCKNLAAEEDFLKLRKKMATENNDDNMVDVARKIFRSKCFTTEQIKNLSVLFLNDGGKYKFFDAAYPFVSDAYNFSLLQTQLNDNYFIARFKAMIRH